MKWMGQTVGLLVATLVLGLAVNALSPKGIQWIGQWDTSQGVVTARAKDDAVHSDVEINNPMKVKEIVEQGSHVVIDVRLRDAYAMGHLPGALSFPLAEFDEIMDELMGVVTRTSPILVYCSGFTCTDSHTFAQRLRDFGFTGVKVYAGGFREWEEMGFEIEE